MPQYCVQVRRIGTDEVVRQLGPMSEKKAEVVERGLLRQLNRDSYYTEVVLADEDEDEGAS